MRIPFTIVLTLLAATLLRAAPQPKPRAATTRTANDDPSAPRAALLMYDKIVGPHDVARAREAYHARTTRERAIADVLAKLDASLANLRAQATAKFDPDVADAMLHVVKASTKSDINQARIVVTGDTAAVTFPGAETPTEMVKVNGDWKISVKDMLKGPNPNPRAFRQAMSKLQAGVDKVADKIQQGQYTGAEDASADLLKAYKSVIATRAE
jgi:hypothetical protein